MLGFQSLTFRVDILNFDCFGAFVTLAINM